MAIVPYRGTPTLNATQNPTPYQNIPVDEDMFGGAIGRGLQNLSRSFDQFGNAMADNALKVQQRANEAHSDELFNQATIELGQLDAKQGVLSGKARYDAYNGYVQQAQGIRKKYLDAAGNPEAARLFDRQFSRRLAYGVVNEAEKAATALQQYENDAKVNKMKLLTEQAGASQDERALDLNLQQIDSTVDQAKDLPSNKWSPEHTEVVRGQLHDQAMMNFIQNLTLSNPMRAQKILDERKDQFQDPKNYDSIKQKVDQGMLRAGTRQDADEIWQSVKPQSNLSDGQGNPYLKQQRDWIRQEIQDDPNLHRFLRGVLAHEQDPGERSKVFEAMANRLNYLRDHGEPNLTLKEYLSREGSQQFYGPIRRGEINEAYLQKTDRQAASIDKEIAHVLGGSNDIRGMTDQGSKGDPNFGIGETIMSNGEGYSDFGRGAARAWRLQQQDKVAAAALGGQQTASINPTVATDASGDVASNPDHGIQVAQNAPPQVKNDFVSPDTLGNALAKVNDYAAKRYPNDPGMQAMYRDELIQRLKTNYATDRAVLKEQRQARQTIVFSELIAQPGQKGPTQLEDLSPQAYLAYQDMDPVQQRAVAKQLEANAKADVPLNDERFARYNTVMGMAVSQPDAFMDIAPGELDLPRTLQAKIFAKQRAIQAKTQDTTHINNALRTVSPMLNDAGIFASRTNTDANSKYNQFIGAFDQKLSDFQNEKKRMPSEEEQRQIAAGLIGDVAGSGWFGTNYGAQKGFEVPQGFIDEWTPKFVQKYHRAPTARDMFNLYQMSLHPNGQ